MTVVIGATTFFILPHDPATAKFLSAGERESILLGLKRDRVGQEEQEDFSWGTCLDALQAPHMWLIFAQFFCSGGECLSFITTSSDLIEVSDALLPGFLYTQYVLLSVVGFHTDDPAIVQAIGYRGTSIQLHSVPPYVCSTFTSLVACYMGDRLRHRGTFVVVAGCVSIVGYAMYLSSTNPNVLYASLFLQIMGVYTVAPLQSTWMREFLSAGCHSF